MNPRVLELIKDPKNIQFEDLGLLKEEIHTFPYIQNIRALHLYGVHLYEKENYQKELSTTAAYTTDKKILYQLINGKIKQEPKPEIVEEKKPSKAIEKPTQLAPKKSFPIKREEDVSVEKPTEEHDTACVLPTTQEVKHIYVNGERNRILFEGEENFLDEQNSETIDIESTLESGVLVTQKTEPIVEEPVKQEEKQAETGENFTPETIIHEDQISSEKEEEKIDEEENISFHEVAPVVPEENLEEVVEEPVKTESTANETEIVSEEEPSQQEIQVEIEENAGENFTPETIIDEDQISAAKEEVNDTEEASSVELSDAEVSFHGTESFMPDVKIQANNEEISETAEVSQPHVNKHEEEMRRLIEEVEKKMKEAKPVVQEEKIEPEATEDHEISFAETQNFHFWSTSEDKPSEIKEEPVKEKVVEDQLPTEEEVKVEAAEEKEKALEVQSAWKPMSVESNLPDSLISKSTEVAIPEIKAPIAEIIPAEKPEPVIEAEAPTETIEGITEIVQEDTVEKISEAAEDHSAPIETTEENTDKAVEKEEVPVMNVSFFGTDISTLKVEDKQKESKEEPVEQIQEVTMKNTTQPQLDSNVPGFINTWQSWLKIDRTEEIIKEKSEIKEKAIETFIENNPRISQLKEESSYVVKEKNDDISHLMTETLANLYFEQKLYTKAIKAFEILIKKSPEKKEYFESKIQDIKDFRSKN
ncbi:hypothetical protein [Chryseobacterium sediminis]|uniref:hypothetical protein n=1 Tax=Chryseobacterium sediminis TaxID=1679494 RepID=UPI00285AD50F|nr:hypothetical protein [Chryseobacterium sediminis]MDR6465394.1 hypothetical protein [Chryseobacterium sediminis]